MSSYFQKKVLNGIKIYNLVPPFKRFIICTDFIVILDFFIVLYVVYFIVLYFCRSINIK